MNWGKHKENELRFFAPCKVKKNKFLISVNRIYIAFGRFRLRLMNPFREHTECCSATKESN